MSNVYLVSCVSAKREQPAPAADLYVSALFIKARAYVERREPEPRWFILSALHGLLDPTAVIAPYNVTLNTMGSADRKTWGERVFAQLRRVTDPGRDQLVFLAGAAYRAPLSTQLAAAGYRVSVPMQGLTIGRQLQWLGNETPRA